MSSDYAKQLGACPRVESRRESRGRLVAAATELIRTRAYSELSVEAVMREAGIGRTIFYRHFDDLADLILTASREAIQQLFRAEEELAQARADDDPAAVRSALEAAVADEILARGRRPRREGLPWDERVPAVCGELRDAMLAYRDGAEVVATVHAFGLGAGAPGQELEEALADGGFPPELGRTAVRTLLHFVFGHVSEEQTHLQAGSAGAIDGAPREGSDFELGLAIVMDGIRLRQRASAR